jgi:hypothetical protein
MYIPTANDEYRRLMVEEEKRKAKKEKEDFKKNKKDMRFTGIMQGCACSSVKEQQACIYFVPSASRSCCMFTVGNHKNPPYWGCDKVLTDKEIKEKKAKK